MEQNRLSQAQELQLGNRTVWLTVIVNLLLSAFKILAGVFGRSAAMVSDGVHSASDVLSSFFVLFGIHISHKKADEHHPYGHEKLESVTAIGVAALLAVVAGGIGYKAIQSLLHPTALATPSGLALSAALISIVTKEWMFRYTRKAARKLNSPALEADAWHHRSDAFSSIGSLVGIGGAMLGLKILDPLAALVICLLIFKAVYDLLKQAIDQLVDSAAPQEVVEEIRQLILGAENIQRLDDLKTRQHGAKLYVDVEIALDKALSLECAHAIAEQLHDRIEAANPAIKHCMVHVNPCEEAHQYPQKNETLPQ